MFRLPLLTLIAASLLALAPAPPSTAQPTPAPVQLLADLNTATESSQFGEAVTLGPLLYFVRYVGQSGELWRSDGSAEGTLALYRFGQNVSPSNLTVVGSTLYFLVYSDGAQPYRELWRSDGTAAGTTPVQAFSNGNGPRNLTAVGGQLLFFIGNMLWRSDGTLGGAQPVREFDPAVYQYASLANADRLFFVPGRSGGFDGPGSQLWASDGTTAGTLLLREFEPTPDEGQPQPRSSLRLLATHQGALYLEYEREGLSEIWRSDGTAAGTVRLGLSIVGSRLYSLGDGLYFTVDSQLWRGDGTPQGSQIVLDLEWDRDLTFENTSSPIAYYQGFFYFTAADTSHGIELWRSDGTAAGTALVKDIYPGPSGSRPAFRITADGRIFLFADDGVYGSELWRSDGSPQNTALIADLTTSNASSMIGASIEPTITSDQRLFFTTANGSESAPTTKLWSSDGTPAGTKVISDSIRLSGGVALGDKLLFSRYGQPGLLVSDGTALGTALIYEGFVSFYSIAKAAGRAFFTSYTFDEGYTFWATDGSAAGTQRLLSLFGETQILPTDSGVFLVSSGGDGRYRLRFSDGTAAGTTSPIPLPIQGYLRIAIAIGGQIYFVVNGDDKDLLWVSDGTSAGTSLIDALQGVVTTQIRGLGARAIIIRRRADGFPNQLWRSDGTVAGTELFSQLSGRSISGEYPIVATKTHLFFMTVSATTWDLWSSDGSASGTQMLRAGKWDGTSGPLSSLTPLGDLLLFAGDDGEPWLSDGTPAGTYRLHDINPGPAGSAPFAFSLVGRQLFFAANDGTHGSEPWVSAPSLRLVGPSAVGAIVGEAKIDLRVQEISLAEGATVTLSVTLDPALSYLGNAQGLTPTEQGGALVFSWPAGAALRLSALGLRVGLPADAPSDQGYKVEIAATADDPADAPADNQLSVELRRSYRLLAPIVAN